MILALRLRPALLSGYSVQGKQSASSPLHVMFPRVHKINQWIRADKTRKQFQYVGTLVTQEVVVCLTECPSALRPD